MKRNRPKYAARNRAAAKARQQYLTGQRCRLCLKRFASEVHHIAGRNAAACDAIAAQYESEKNWLPLCRECHELIDKQTPALWACAAKLEMGELDLDFLRSLRTGRRFAFNMAELSQAVDDLEQWRLLQ